MAPIPFPGRNFPAYSRGQTTFPVGTTKGRGAPIAPHATGAWVRLMGAVGTRLPTAQRQARLYRRRALQAIR